jgi:hypothetical protein
MKYLFTLSFIAIFTSTYSQVTVNQNDMPSAGDTLRFSVAANAVTIDPGNSGSNQTWDFSNLQSSSQYVDDFLPVSQTPFTYIAVFGLPFSSAASDMGRLDNSAFQVPTIPVVNVTINDVYNFYKTSSASFQQKGFGVSINGFPVPIQFSSGDVLVPLPLNTNSTSTNAYSFDATIPTLGYYGRDAVRNNEVDGSGTLITPFGTFQTLRLRSELVYTDSVAIDALGFGFQLPEFTEVKYKWLAPGYGWPLLEITANSIFGAETVSRVVYRDSVATPFDIGFADVIDAATVNVFPNPASEILQISMQVNTKSSMKFELFNALGQSVYSRQSSLIPGQAIELIPLLPLGLSNGTYFLSISQEGQPRITRPFFVQNK